MRKTIAARNEDGMSPGDRKGFLRCVAITASAVIGSVALALAGHALGNGLDKCYAPRIVAPEYAPCVGAKAPCVVAPYGSPWTDL